MKKLISMLLLLIMTVSFIGCSSADEEENKKLKDDVFGLYEELRPIYTGNTTNEEVRDYLAGIADREEIYNKKLPGDSLLLMEQADPHFENTPSTTLQCSISTSNRHRDAQSAAIALSVLRNTEDHGRITVLFTGEDKGDPYGSRSLPITYLNTDNFINLRYDSKAKLITGSACAEKYTLKSQAEIKEIGTNKTYEISIVSREGVLSEGEKSDLPNPIMTLGLLLSDCKNSGINLRISSFEGSFSSKSSPLFAKAVITIQPDDEQRLTKKVESAMDKFKSKYNEIEPQMDYTFTPIDNPTAVLSHDSTTRLLSLIYTIDEGTSQEDSEDITAYKSTVEKISISKNIEVTVVGRSFSVEGQENSRTSYESIAKLNGYSFSSLPLDSLWESSEENPLAESITIAAGQNDLTLESTSSLYSNDCSIFTTTKEDLQAVSFGVNIQQGFEISQSLILFLESLHKSKI